MDQMMADPAAGRHARSGHDDGAALDLVDGNGSRRVACEMQSRKREGVYPLIEQRRHHGAEFIAVPLENLSCGYRHWGIEIDPDGGWKLGFRHPLAQEEQQ